MNAEQFAYSGLISLLLVLIALFFRESLTQLISKFFSTLTNAQVKVVYLLLLVIISIPFWNPNLLPSTGLVEPDTKTTEGSITKEQLIDKGIDIGIEVAEDLIERKRAKDSTRLANKPKKWVYKIGVSAERKNHELFKLFEKLEPLGNIYAFQESKKSYFLIKDDNWTYNSLLNNIDKIRASLPDKTSRIEIVDLMDYCTAKEKIMATSLLSWKKAKRDIQCFICSK